MDAHSLDHLGRPQSYVLSHYVLLPLQGTDTPSASPRKQGCVDTSLPHSTSSACRTLGLVTEAPKGTLQCADSKNVLLALSHFRVSTKDTNNQVGGLSFSLGLSLPMLFGGDKNAQSQHFDTSLQKETQLHHTG